MSAIHTEEVNGYRIQIWPDEDVGNPRTEYDNMGHMICWHTRHNLGDEHDMDTQELKAILNQKGVIYLPLFLYDHSGITMSTGNSYPYNDQWDAGQVGFIYATPADIRKNFNCKKITKAIKERALKNLQSEVEIYDLFIRGEVYGYVVHTESCWGFYGFDWCLEDARSTAKNLPALTNIEEGAVV